MKPALLLILALPAAVQDAPEQVPFKVVGTGDRCGSSDAVLTPLKTPKEWEAAWAKLHPIKAPPAPAVDFDKEVALIVTLGTAPSSGYGVEIVRVEKAVDEIRVRAKRRLPNPEFKYAQALTQPYTILKMEKTTLKLVLIKEETK